MQRHHLLGPRPLGPGGGAKRSNIIKSGLQSQFQRFLNHTLNLSDGIFIRPLAHAKGWDLGVPWGVGGIFFLPKFNQIWCLSYLHELHMHRHNCLGPQPLGPREGVTNFNFLNMVMWHIKLKGMSSTQGFTENF